MQPILALRLIIDLLSDGLELRLYFFLVLPILDDLRNLILGEVGRVDERLLVFKACEILALDSEKFRVDYVGIEAWMERVRVHPVVLHQRATLDETDLNTLRK